MCKCRNSVKQLKLFLFLVHLVKLSFSSYQRVKFRPKIDHEGPEEEYSIV